MHKDKNRQLNKFMQFLLQKYTKLHTHTHTHIQRERVM